MCHTLTVVVPYFKLRYFDAALGSLAQQTNKDFDVFIGDDGSPENPSATIEKYRSLLNINYRRFEHNLGHRSIAVHWNRCVRETTSEWIWLFSDDDVASADCVAAFCALLAQKESLYDVYRFNIRVIDSRGTVIHQPPPHPAWESGEGFVFAKVSERRASCAIEYIFRRRAFDAAGGFVDFPLGWCSDDASWIAFSRRAGIRTIEGAEVLWRQSGLNLSAPNPKNASAKLAAWRKYFLWIRNEFHDPLFERKYLSNLKSWFPLWFDRSDERPGLRSGLAFWLFFCRYTRSVNLKLFYFLIKVGVLQILRVVMGCMIPKSADDP